MPYWKLGRKIAEGGQAEIFEVMDIDGIVHPETLFKVFKRGSRLSDLKKQWPGGILKLEVLCVVQAGTMFDDGRFAFGMIKCWGDLRKLIDQAMQEKNNQGPPFPYKWSGQTLHVQDIMCRVAFYMDKLHKKGIIHRDLKAANILLHPIEKNLGVLVVDFECSSGVVGTGFWRAPEILLALKNRSVIDFSEKVDVYSYGMTCFEIVIGCLPFEGELEACQASYDLVIGGWRPKLPNDLDGTLKDLIERCWNPIPNERPSFSKILQVH